MGETEGKAQPRPDEVSTEGNMILATNKLILGGVDMYPLKKYDSGVSGPNPTADDRYYTLHMKKEGPYLRFWFDPPVDRDNKPIEQTPKFGNFCLWVRRKKPCWITVRLADPVAPEEWAWSFKATGDGTGDNLDPIRVSESGEAVYTLLEPSRDSTSGTYREFSFWADSFDMNPEDRKADTFNFYISMPQDSAGEWKTLTLILDPDIKNPAEP
jgi:hypothetical protein